MAHELEVNIDWGPVRKQDILVYRLPGKRRTPTSLTVEGVLCSSPFSDGGDYEIDVTVEYVPDEYALDIDAFASNYLAAYSHARVVQESMTRKIRADLMGALDIDDVFVELHRKSPAHKRTRIGKPT